MQRLPLLAVSAGADDSIRVGESIVLNPVISDISLISSVQWTPAATLSCDDCQNPAASPVITTVYTLSITDVNDCTYSDVVRVTVYSDAAIFIPNIFTPNGDGYNDIFYITGKEISTIRFMVFNRWGEKVFETNEANAGWDGTHKGKMMNPGVYTYMAEVTYLGGDTDILKGSLTLLR